MCVCVCVFVDIVSLSKPDCGNMEEMCEDTVQIYGFYCCILDEDGNDYLKGYNISNGYIKMDISNGYILMDISNRYILTDVSNGHILMDISK